MYPLLQDHFAEHVDSITSYLVLYHEVALANLLEVSTSRLPLLFAQVLPDSLQRVQGGDHEQRRPLEAALISLQCAYSHSYGPDYSAREITAELAAPAPTNKPNRLQKCRCCCVHSLHQLKSGNSLCTGGPVPQACM